MTNKLDLIDKEFAVDTEMGHFDTRMTALAGRYKSSDYDVDVTLQEIIPGCEQLFEDLRDFRDRLDAVMADVAHEIHLDIIDFRRRLIDLYDQALRDRDYSRPDSFYRAIAIALRDREGELECLKAQLEYLSDMAATQGGMSMMLSRKSVEIALKRAEIERLSLRLEEIFYEHGSGRNLSYFGEEVLPEFA